MEELTGIIENAVHDVEDGADADTTETTDTSSLPAASGSDDTSKETVGSGDEGVSGSAGKESTGDPVKAADPIDALLDAEGVKPPVEGIRENRIPYTRVRKIVENAVQKQVKTHTDQLAAKDAEYAPFKQKAAQMDAADQMILQDPDRYIRTLAVMHPQLYSKYAFPQQQVERSVAPVAPVVPFEEQPPPPDHKFEDGAMGYTAEGHQKLMNWYAEKGKREALAEMKKEINPLLQKQKTTELQAQYAATAKTQVDRARETWGELFDQDYAKANEGKSEILAYMKLHPNVPFDAQVAAVLKPKLVADRGKIREEVHKELNARPRAAVKAVPSVTKADAEAAGPVSLEDVVRQAISTVR